MNKRLLAAALVATGVIAAAGYGVYSLGMTRGMGMGGGSQAAAAPEPGRRVLYWHDPMVPGPKFDKPGKSPFMDMQLVPVYADEGGGDAGTVRIDPRIQQNLGIRTSEVTVASMGAPVEAVGSVAYNERDVAVVQARSNGYVERLLVRAPLDPVRRGQPLAELYVPDWIAAQEEYLAARRMSAAAPAGLLDAARQRMRLAGMTESQVALVETGGAPHPRMTLTSPLDGIVTELTAREGMTVASGAPLFRINGIQTVWVNAEIPENMAGQVRPGTTAEVTTAAFPEKSFKGRVTAILPEVNAVTRTIKARVEVANPERLLTPGMFARVTVAKEKHASVLVIPSDAVIRTGTRNLVMVVREEGRFAPVEVDVGTEAGGKTEIRKGLSAGDKVVVSGQFLVDSEARLRGVEPRVEGSK
ncbi:MAG TPA: efflux RND transporter periplasmic adaptor subunit [Usitatibacter sp.]|nr:efflux RND transporter periplasmic adaptor subunit [Usitatibacter sp.]